MFVPLPSILSRLPLLFGQEFIEEAFYFFDEVGIAVASLPHESRCIC